MFTGLNKKLLFATQFFSVVYCTPVYSQSSNFIPTAFTPNNDGLNDVLKLIAPGIAQLFYFRIYNRWGQLIFETGNSSRAWNGNDGNRPAASGAYVWLVKGIDYKGKPIEKKEL